MVVTALDTHELVKQLTAAGFTGEQAEVLTLALRKTQDIDLSSLATKADLAALKAELKADTVALALATKADLAEVKAELKADIAALALSVKADLAEVKAEVVKWMLGQTIVIIGTVVALVKMIGH